MRAVMLEVPQKLLDERRRLELLRSVGGRLLPVSADVEGVVRSDVLGAQFTTVAGQLRITWEDGCAEL